MCKDDMMISTLELEMNNMSNNNLKLSTNCLLN